MAAVFGIVAALGLFATSLFAFVIPANATDLPFGLQLDLVLLTIPLAEGALVGTAAVGMKWKPYASRKASGHFMLSVFAATISLAILVLVPLAFLGLIALTDVFPLFPFSVLGISLGLVSMAEAWEGFGRWKGTSIAAALLFPVGFFYLVLFYPEEAVRAALPLVYLTGALLLSMSGVMLLIMASSTAPSQRAILKASHSHLETLRRELDRRQEALRYKEKAFIQQESGLDARERELAQAEAQVADRRRELAEVQAKAQGRAQELRELERRLAGMRAEVEAKVEEVALKEADFRNREKALEATRKELAAREAGITEREKELKRRHIELASHERGLKGRERELQDRERRVKEAAEQVEERRAEAMKRAKELELRESALKMKMEQLQAQVATEEQERVRELKEWEDRILAKEKELGQADVELRRLENELRAKYEDATRIEQRIQEERDALLAREKEFVAREQAISDKEAALAAQGKELAQLRATVQRARENLEEKERRYGELLKSAKMRQAEASTNQEELARRARELEAMERRVVEMKEGVKEEIQNLNEANRVLLAKQKELEAMENELSLRELEMETKARESRAAAATPGVVDLDRERQIELRERRLREREEEFKRRLYQKEKELEMREQALRAHLKGEAEVAEEVAASEASVQKARTGTPRLDDLLYGGIPFHSNVLFVGPAFVGKEVGILAFLAEGLKKNVPCVIVTTSKPPVDVARDMAPILPTFIEYEQLGLVWWIDASASLSDGKGPVREENRYRVNGPADFDGILIALNELDDLFKERGSPYFRLAYLTLSTSITQADEKEALNFVQRFVNRLRQTTAIGAFALERGMHTDRQVEGLEHVMDGALHFYQDKSRTFLQVAGLGEAQTRDPVPYKFTNKALLLGAFQLERIR
jgi:KaiC/GvpD/RAD55 family RecA-like ATPase